MENNTSAYDNGKEYDANYNGGNIGSDGSAATNINDKHPSHGNKSKDNMNAEDNGKEPQPLRGRMHDIDLENTEQKEYEPPFVYKLVKTIFLVSVWITMGLCGEITGPTLLDLKFHTKSNYEEISHGLSGRGVGFFVGSALGGPLLDKLGRYGDVILALAIDGNAVTTLAIPWMQTADMLFLMTLLQGTAEGVINVAGQKLLLDIWKEKATGPLHLLHAGYGIGSFLIPLIANPFLAIIETLYENTTTDVNVDDLGVTMTTRLPTTTEVEVKESRMIYAYIIAAAATVLVSFIFFGYQILGIAGERIRSSQDVTSCDERIRSPVKRALSFKEIINPATCANGRLIYGLQIFASVFLFYFLAEGVEVVNGKFVRTYAVEALDFSKDNGSYVNTAFWVAFTVGRFLGLITGRFVPIRLLIMLETGGCVVASVLLCIFGDRTLPFWILAPYVGFYIGPLFPSGIGWANHHIELTGVAITFFMLGGAVGNYVCMRLVGYLLDHIGYRGYLYVVLGLSIGSFVIAGLMDIVGSQHGSRFVPEEQQTDILDQRDQEDDSAFENEAYKCE